MLRTHLLAGAGLVALILASGQALAGDTTGITDTEIKIGQTMAYSGPASAYGVIGKTEAAVFQMINDQGGVNGRKINFISLDDGYSPPKANEQTRRLVEEDGVAFTFNNLGTPTNSAIQKYLNQKKVPQLFVATGADKWGNYKDFPWTIGFQPSYRTEAQIFAKYILKNKPDAKIGIFYQNDDFGKDYILGVKDVLGERYATMVVKEVSYETTDATIDSQIVTLQSAGADTLVTAMTPKFAAQAIRKIYDIGWKPLHLMTDVSQSVAAVMNPIGPEKGVGIITATYGKEPTDPQWKDDPGMNQWRAFMTKYIPDGDQTDVNYAYGYGAALTMVQVLKQCGSDLSRENVMKQAANLKDFDLPTLLPGIKVNTSPTNFHPIRQEQLEKWNGKTWERFGEIISGGES
ncbi:MAG TPA: ABC transporter substrate-binding protein [Stellaceae bacterium]|nr:ABC transporter substrate-binding protein [Stellaceae bacterium]